MRKKAAKLAIFLFLGAIVNLAVAWWYAYRLPAYQGVHYPLYEQNIAGYIMSDSKFPRWCFYWNEQIATRVYHWFVEYEDGQMHFAPLAESLKQVPHWTTVGNTTPPPKHELAIIPTYMGFVEEARGWPLLSFSCRLEMKYDPLTKTSFPDSVSGGIAIKREEWPTPMFGVIWIHGTLPLVGPLPYRPIWPGVLANSVLYAIPLFLIFHTPIWLRRSFRKRRNCCLDCGYPIGASTNCTECGNQLIK